MSKPYSQPSKFVLLQAITGRDHGTRTPRWMDRKFGYTPKTAKFKKGTK